MDIRFLYFLMTLAMVQQVGATETGKAAALKYFTENSKNHISTRAPAGEAAITGGERTLGISFGHLLQTKNYNWSQEDLTGWSVEASYLRAGDSFLARGFSLELQKFATDNQELSKVSFLFTFIFPKRVTFPVYLGAAAGPSYFVKQQEGESEFAVDYKGFLGFRYNQTSSQYFLQGGVKNHVHVLSDGQFFGWYVSSGVAYKF